jgi:hypothetical protein
MPLQYAIQEIIPFDDLRPDEEIEPWNSETVYHSVPQEFAENDEENGYFCLANNKGERVSPWIPLNRELTKRTMESLRTMKSKGAPHKDIMGEELAIGDFVALGQNENAELDVGKVVAFTDKKVRILIYRWWFEAVLKNPSGLIKIQPNIISD